MLRNRMNRSPIAFMSEALRLAAKARGKTAPNPMVGAVVVNDGKIVGRGFHPKAGQPHAEIFALRQAGKKARGGTLYVSLEPCAHTGRTPPCVDAIRRAGIRRVVAAMIDPNPITRGRGLAQLKRQGIATQVGLLKNKSQRLNADFIRRMNRTRPEVTLKIAQSLDGKIATRTGQSRWITSVPARVWTHRLRARMDAILIGIGTVLKDDPRLTVRGAGSSAKPVRIVLDSRLRMPVSARMLKGRGGPVWIAALPAASLQKEKRLRAAGAEVFRVPARQRRVNLAKLMELLNSRGIKHLLIEGGAETAASALDQKLVDHLAWIIAPKIIGGRAAVPSVGGIGAATLKKAVNVRRWKFRSLGPDILVTADFSGTISKR